MTQVIRWEHVQNVSGLGLKNTYELMWCGQCVGVVWEKSSHSSYAIFGDPRGRYGVGHRPSLDEAKASAVERAAELGIIKSQCNGPPLVHVMSEITRLADHIANIREKR